MQAEADDEGISSRVLALSSVVADNLDTVASVTVSTMIVTDTAAPTLATLCTAHCRARPEFTGMSILFAGNKVSGSGAALSGLCRSSPLNAANS
ncbi:hypothetical protein [Streptomyces sp. C36]|uniref:hypothetical protein n=1 Tax=Streptomyces sp. C36 TaxID=3237122 RepID=UPI0034C5B8BE